MEKQLRRFLLTFGVYWLTAAIVPTQVAHAQTFQAGDVFVSLSDNVNGGKVEWHRANGTLVKTMLLGTTSTTPGAVGAAAVGMGFDSKGNFYVTQPNDGLSGRVLKFDANGNLLDPNWGHPPFPSPGYTSPYKCLPGAIVFDSKDTGYVGHIDCQWLEGSTTRTTSIRPAGTKMVNVIKLASDGTVLTGEACPFPNTSTTCHPEGPDSEGMLHVVADSQGSNRLALASDDCTLYYTSNSATIKVFNVCAPTASGLSYSPVQRPDLATFPGAALQDLRVLPDGSVVVADGGQIEHIVGGTIAAALDPHSSYFRKQIVSVALNIDGVSLWVADRDSGQVYKVNLGTGAEDTSTSFFVPPYTTGAVAVAPILPGGASYGGGGTSKQTPTITWNTPSAITFGTPLSSTQLDATASVPGTFAYTPAAGTVLPAGSPTLFVTFTPTDTTHYNSVTAHVTLTINRTTPSVTWATPAAITYGTPLSSTQLNATASVPGTFAYTPPSGTVLAAGSQTLSVTFTPTDAGDYTTASATVTLTVNPGTPSSGPIFQAGDVFVSLADNVNGGKVQWHRADGSLVKTIYLGTTSTSSGAVGAPAVGMGFDAKGNLYVTQPNDGLSGRVLKFDAGGNQLDPNWGHPSFPIPGYTTPYRCLPTAMVFDSQGFVYVGQADCLWNEGSTNRTTSTQPAGTKMVNVLKLAGDGTVQAGRACAFPNTDPTCHPEGPDSEGMLHVVAEGAGSNRLALAADDCTLYYTSNSQNLKVFNVCTATASGLPYSPVQRPDLASFPGAFLQDLRILPDGSVVVADGGQIEHIAGGTIRSPLDAHSIYFRKQIVSVAVNIDGATLWVADNDSGQIYKVNLSSGAEDTSASFFAPSFTIGAVAVAPILPGGASYGGSSKQTPTISWAPQTPITYGTALGSAQLNATATIGGTPVAGTFVYSPAAPTVLGVGLQTLSVTFMPTDTAHYNNATATVTITVNKATPAITWANPGSIAYGTALSSTQLNATANVPGTFGYTPASGTVLSIGSQTLSVTFTPNDTVNYNNATATVTLVVTPVVTISAPASSPEGTAITATSSVTPSGSYTYSWTVTKTRNGTTTNFATGSASSFTFTPDDDGTYTVSLSVTGSGATGTASASITVTNLPPTVAIGGVPANSPEGIAIPLTGLVSSPAAADQAAGYLYSWTVLRNSSPFASGSSANLTFTPNHFGSYTVTLTATDKDGLSGSASGTINVTNVAPVITSFIGPTMASISGSAITLTANLTDAGTADTHTCTFTWDDGTTSAGTVTETSGSGSCAGTHTYPTAGVYAVGVTVTDDGGLTASSVFKFVVIFDPTEGYVNGAGSFQSAAGSYVANPSLAGPAYFGFYVRYALGALVPSGTNSFRFAIPNIDFKTTAFEWLVIVGANAQFRGSGTINGTGNYEFLVTITDGQQTGGGGVDKYRIKLTDNNNAGAVVYDNVMGAPDNLSTANPEPISSGRVVIFINTPPTVTSLTMDKTTVTEGGQATLTGTFTDPDPGQTHTATINWGDGTANDTVNIAAGIFTFSTSHFFKSTTTAINVTVADNFGATGTGSTPITIVNVAPTITKVTSPSGVLTTGTAAAVQVNFTDPGWLDTFTCSIAWGNAQTSSGSVTATNGVGACTATYTYPAAGSYTAVITVTDRDGASVSTSVQIVVDTPPAISTLALSATTINEGDTTALNGTFADPDPGKTHKITINWGDSSDNTILTLAAGTFSFSSTHRYLDNPPGIPTGGKFSIIVAVADNYFSATGSLSITVNNVAPVITSTVANSLPIWIQYYDPGIKDYPHTCTVSWGDGQTTTFPADEGGSYCTSGHPYASPGTYTIVVTVVDKDGGSGSKSFSLVVN